MKYVSVWLLSILAYTIISTNGNISENNNKATCNRLEVVLGDMLVPDVIRVPISLNTQIYHMYLGFRPIETIESKRNYSGKEREYG